MFDVTTRVQPGFTVAALAHRGPYAEIGDGFRRLGELMGRAGLLNIIENTVGFYYDDPTATPPAELRSHAGATLKAGVAVPDGAERIEVAESEIAVVTVKGPYSQIAAAWKTIYGDFLPSSGREIGDRPPYERYLNEPMVTAEADLLTEICVPLKPLG